MPQHVPVYDATEVLPSAATLATGCTVIHAGVIKVVNQVQEWVVGEPLALSVGATLPSTAGRSNGSPFVKTPEHILYVVINGSWVSLGGGVAIPDLVVTDANGVAWQLAADDTGHLLLSTYTGTGTPRPAGSGPVLADAAAGNWRVEVDITGHASTITSGTAEYAENAGPTLASATRTWRLGVDTTGHLTLTSLS